jgi:hypothetical protein
MLIEVERRRMELEAEDKRRKGDFRLALALSVVGVVGSLASAALGSFITYLLTK